MRRVAVLTVLLLLPLACGGGGGGGGKANVGTIKIGALFPLSFLLWRRNL